MRQIGFNLPRPVKPPEGNKRRCPDCDGRGTKYYEDTLGMGQWDPCRKCKKTGMIELDESAVAAQQRNYIDGCRSYTIAKRMIQAGLEDASITEVRTAARYILNFLIIHKELE